MGKGARTPTGRNAPDSGIDHYVNCIDVDGATPPTLQQTFTETAAPGVLWSHARVTAGVASATLSAADDKIVWREFENLGTARVWICGDGGAADATKKALDPGRTFSDGKGCGLWTVIRDSVDVTIAVTTCKTV